MTRRHLLITTLAAAMLLGGGVATANISQAHAADPALVVTEDGHSFYTDAGVSKAWSALVANYPEALPAGHAFPATLPPFFHGASNTRNLWEVGLVDEIAARYWRCAWVGQQADSQKLLTSTAQVRSAAAGKALSKYNSLPGVNAATTTAYDATVQKWAEDRRQTPAAAEFAIDCAGISTEE